MGIKKAAPQWMLALLERWKKLIERIEEQAEEIEAELRAGAPLQELLFGEGELTHELLARELARGPESSAGVRELEPELRPVRAPAE